MSAPVTIGDFKEADRLPNSLLLVRLILPANDFLLDWRRYGLVANYLAEYSAYHFGQKDRAENLISSVFYELLERLAASSRREAKLDIKLVCAAEWLLFELGSSLPSEEVARLKELLAELQGGGLDEYFQRLIGSDLESESNRKKLGVAMIAHDYHARLSGQLDQGDGSVVLRALLAEKEIYA